MIGKVAKADKDFKKKILIINLPYEEFYPERFHKWYPWLGIGADHNKKQRPSIIKTFLPIYLSDMGIKATYLYREGKIWANRYKEADIIITIDSEEAQEASKYNGKLISLW